MNEDTDETLSNETPDARVKWDCFSCGKHLGEQGPGGSFTLDFGYGSRLDETRGITGWVCDECVAQKHGRLRVSDGTKGIDYWLEAHMVPLCEHDETKTSIEDMDFYGRRKMPWALDNDKRPMALQGWREYHSITAEERSRVEAWLFNEEPLDRDVVVKLLQTLMESEGARAEAEQRRWQAECDQLARARQQAERLSADELAQLRARERKRWSADTVTRVWEHAEWNERHFREQDEKITTLRDRVKELEAENAALKRRLDR